MRWPWTCCDPFGCRHLETIVPAEISAAYDVNKYKNVHFDTFGGRRRSDKMAASTACCVLLLALLLTTDGQSTTSTDSRCVYSFNVAATDCSQTPDSNVEVQVVKSLAVGLQAQVKQLVSELRDLRAELAKSKTGERNIIVYIGYNKIVSSWIILA